MKKKKPITSLSSEKKNPYHMIDIDIMNRIYK